MERNRPCLGTAAPVNISCWDCGALLYVFRASGDETEFDIAWFI